MAPLDASCQESKGPGGAESALLGESVPRIRAVAPRTPVKE